MGCAWSFTEGFMPYLLSDMNPDHFHVKQAVLLVWNGPQVTKWIGYFSAGLAVIAALSAAYEGQWPHLVCVTAKRLCVSSFCPASGSYYCTYDTCKVSSILLLPTGKTWQRKTVLMYKNWKMCSNLFCLFIFACCLFA